MAFSVPTFPFKCDIFTGPANTRVLRVHDVDCNLAWGRRVSDGDVFGNQNEFSAYMTLLLPAGTDVRDMKVGYQEDIVEVPTGSGRLYQVASVDDIGKGFPNEHRAAIIMPGSEAIFGTASNWNGIFWPTPIP